MIENLARAGLCLLLCLALPALADDPWVHETDAGSPEIQVYFFWSESCPHCRQARPHVEALPKSRPWLRLHSLELTRHPEQVAKFQALARAAGGEASAVPTLIFCAEMHVGWDSEEGTGRLIRQRLDACHARLLRGEAITAAAATQPLRLPLLGTIDPEAWSLPAMTVLLAGLDAFNPCAFFVLLFLLSMLAQQRHRRRMALVGGVFVTVSGLMYFAFMAAWLNVFQLFGHLAWLTTAAGALAVFIGLFNLKDFFRFQQGISLSISAAHKADLFRRTRAVLTAEHLPSLLAATLVLAVAANFYELLCTAGFPMVYTRLLTLHDLTPGARYAYLAVYNLIYVLPLALIVFAFSLTLGRHKLSEREGRLLKLLSGLMMLELGGVLLLAPEWLAKAGIALALVLVALGLTALAARLVRADHVRPDQRRLQ